MVDDDDMPLCRYCFDGIEAGELVSPCNCRGGAEHVHRSCLEQWVLERGLGVCEVCRAPYKEDALTERARRRLEDAAREWPQHDEPPFEEAILLAPPNLAAPATRRLLFLSIIALMACVAYLAQDEDVGSAYDHRHVSQINDEIGDRQAEAYLVELGLAPPTTFGAYEYDKPPPLAAPPAPFGMPAVLFVDDDSGADPSPPPPWINHFYSSDASSTEGWRWGPFPPSAAPPRVLPPPVDVTVALHQLMATEGCPTSSDATEVVMGSRTCELAGKVLEHLHRKQQAMRERYEEEEAGEAMWRLARAFVLLCMLRVILAHQQRARVTRAIIERHYHAHAGQALPV